MGLGDKNNKKMSDKTKPKRSTKNVSKRVEQPKARKPKKKSPKKPNTGKIAIGFIIGVVVIIILFIGYSYFSGSEGAGDAPVSDDPGVVVSDNPSSNDKEAIQLSANDHILHNPFSKVGLFEQLVSEGYYHELVTEVVDGMDVDWTEQAVAAGDRYIQYSAPEAKESGLRDQLAYEGFTESEIDDAVQSLDIDALNKEYGPQEDNDEQTETTEQSDDD